MALETPAIEESKLEQRTALCKISIQGNTTTNKIRAFCPNINDVRLFEEEDGNTVANTDAGAGFALTDLDDDAAASVFGLILVSGQVDELIGVELVPNSITGTDLGTLSSITVSKKGASSSGVSASGNICLLITTTSWDHHAATATNTFWLRITYRKKRG